MPHTVVTINMILTGMNEINDLDYMNNINDTIDI